MPDHRVFCPHPASDPAPGRIVLPAPESHHLVTVNRARPGDPVVAFDGAGHEWNTVLQTADRRATTLTVVSPRDVPPRRAELTLFQGLPKGGTMDTIVRQATEIGAARIVPVITEHSQVQLDTNRAEKKQDRWHTTALEAAKQCGNPWLPAIDVPQPWSQVLPQLTGFDALLIASLQPETVSLETWRREFTPPAHPPRIAWLIGPEGDFSAAETAAAITTGARPVSLGPLVLRCDTAAAVALGAVQALLHE